jgi:hypothetical protein
VIRRAIQRNPRLDDPAQRASQVGARWKEDGRVVQACAPRRGRRASEALPRIQANVVVIAARRNKRRLGSKALLQLEPEHVAIEAERALEISHLQVNVADADVRMYAHKSRFAMHDSRLIMCSLRRGGGREPS